jgi:hypothetical protein
MPPEGEDPVRVRTEIRWRNATATVAIPEVFFYSTGVYIPVTYRTLPARPPARQAETEEEEQRQTAQSYHPTDPAKKRPAESVRKVNSIPRLLWLAQIVQFGVSGVFFVKAGHGHQNGAAWDDAGASHAATGSSVPINGATGDTSVTPARGGRCPVLIWLMAGGP